MPFRFRTDPVLRPVRRACAGLLAAALLPTLAEAAPATWPGRLQADLTAIDQRGTPEIGVYVHDLDSGAELSHRATEDWYLASMVKVPVALAVMQAMDHGHLTLDTTVTLRAADYVDGAGPTNALPPGKALTVRWLMEQMIVYSDNTASDMLIELVGLDAVNAVVQTAVPGGFRPITTLAGVRREIYGYLAPGTSRLSGKDFIAIRRQPTDADRIKALHGIVGLPSEAMSARTLDEAYDAYYATRLNSGRLDAYGALLAQLARGELLSASSTRYLLRTMRRVKTGDHRLKAGFPPGIAFAHKTGTQRARYCDAGIVDVPTGDTTRQAVVVACTKGDPSLARSERVLRDVGAAMRNAGFFHP